MTRATLSIVKVDFTVSFLFPVRMVCLLQHRALCGSCQNVERHRLFIIGYVTVHLPEVQMCQLLDFALEFHCHHMKSIQVL
jgi:hypothetical protein